MDAPRPGNKYIVGWLTLHEGAESEIDRLLKPYVATCREEPECRFFEMIRAREDPLTVLVCECFESEAAHAAHVARPHVKKMFSDLSKLAISGTFENVIAGEIAPDSIDF